MSQSDLANSLAQELGKERFDPTSISRMEKGTRPTTVAELEALSRIFDVPPESLFQSETEDLRALRKILNDWADNRARIIGAELLMEGTADAVWEVVDKDPQVLNGLDKRELDILDDLHHWEERTIDKMRREANESTS